MLIRLLYSQPNIGSFFFFFNDTATTEIYTLSLHDALPILPLKLVTMTVGRANPPDAIKHQRIETAAQEQRSNTDRKSTRLNSSHGYISYAVFCLKKKNKNTFLAHISYQHHSYHSVSYIKVS